MTFDDFEVFVRREIENYLNGSNTKSKMFKYEPNMYLVLKWRNTPNTADLRFSITMDNDYSTVDFEIDLSYDNGEDEDDYHSQGSTTVPQTEEEYFQLSTVQDLGFCWEFYEYLIEVFRGFNERRR